MYNKAKQGGGAGTEHQLAWSSDEGGDHRMNGEGCTDNWKATEH